MQSPKEIQRVRTYFYIIFCTQVKISVAYFLLCVENLANTAMHLQKQPSFLSVFAVAPPAGSAN